MTPIQYLEDSGATGIVLRVFQVENRYHSAGRARRFFHSITRSNSCVVPRLFAIVAEQQRKQLIDAVLGYLPSSHSLLRHVRQMSTSLDFFFSYNFLFIGFVGPVAQALPCPPCQRMDSATAYGDCSKTSYQKRPVLAAL